MVDTHKNQIAIKMFSDNVMVGLLGKLLQRAHLYKAEGLMDGSNQIRDIRGNIVWISIIKVEGKHNFHRGILP